MAKQINLSGAEAKSLFQKELKVSFVSNMHALGHKSLAFGSDIMPRQIWATALALALAEQGAIDASQADAIAVALNSDLGNSSQLGTALLKSGDLVRQDAAIAAVSLADILAKRAEAAKQAAPSA